MKKVIVTILALNSFMGISQLMESKKIYKGSFDVIRNVRDSDTSVYFHYHYQNKKYQHITDIGGVFLEQKKDVLEFADNLKLLAEKEKGTSLSYSNRYFEINIYDFSNYVFITDKKGKYTTLTRKEAINISEEIKQNINLLKK